MVGERTDGDRNGGVVVRGGGDDDDDLTLAPGTVLGDWSNV